MSILSAGCVSTTDSNTTFTKVATKHEGLHERKHTKQIKNLIGVSPVSNPWCGYYMAYVVKKSGKTPPKGYPRARAWLKYGKAVKKSDIRRNDIVVVGNHVALVTKVEGKKIHVISGNFSNKIGRGIYNINRIEGIRR